MSEEDDVVGYRHPPKAHRFVKGRSGNPRGRRPRPKQIDTLIDRELDQLITMKEGGREIRLPKREAIVKRLVSLALKGQPRAVEFLIDYAKKHGAPDPFVFEAKDAAAVAEALRRLPSPDKNGREA